jgi:hypothetical protein
MTALLLNHDAATFRKIATGIIEAVEKAEGDFYMHRGGWYEARLNAVTSVLSKHITVTMRTGEADEHG